MQLEIKREWMERMVEKEGDGILSVGGLMCRVLATDANYHAERRALLALHRLWVAGKGESPDANAIRDASDGTWHALSETEQLRLRGLSQDLNEIRGDRPDQNTLEMTPEVQAKLKAANEARRRGEWDRTLELLRQWGKYIEPALLSYMRGAIWFAAGDAETAGVFFEHAVRLEPTNVNFRISFLNSLLQTDVSRAVAEAENVLGAADRSDPAVVVHAAHTALTAVKDVAVAAASGTYSRLIPLLKDAVQRLEQQEDTNRFPLDAAFSLLGVCYESLGDTQSALASYSRALQVDPNDTAVLIARGRLLFGTSMSARSDFELAINLGTQDVWPYFFLAHDYLSHGRFDECRSICERGLRKPASDRVRSELFECLAISQAALEYPAGVVQNSFESALRADPSNERVHRNLETFRKLLANYPIKTEQLETRPPSAVRDDVQEELRKTSRFPPRLLMPAA